MEWIRNVSLVRRVTILCGVLAAAFAVLGGWATAALLQAAAGAPPQSAALAAWSVGIGAAAACVVALLSAWILRSSIKGSVESTVQCVMRIAAGDLETKISSPGRDEISWLRSELNTMRKKLRTMVLEVRETAIG